MERGPAVRGLLLLLLLEVLNVAVAEIETVYFVVGDKLKLRPSPGGQDITDVLWKHNTNLLALWARGDNVTLFGNFKTRTTLDVTSGVLDIIPARSADVGEYTVEINNKPQSLRYQAKTTIRVSKPLAFTQPLTCDKTLDSCTAVCGVEGTTAKAEPVTYSWKQGEGEWVEGERKLEFFKEKTRAVKTFTCRIKNPVSQMDSEPVPNPFFEEASNGVAIGVGVGVPLFLVLLCGGLFLYFRGRAKSRDVSGTAREAPAENGQPAETAALNKEGEEKTDPV